MVSDKGLILRIGTRLRGCWQGERLHLERWKPEVGCCRNGVAPKEAWVRILGLPLHLWIREVFKKIGDCCGIVRSSSGLFHFFYSER